MRALVLCSCLTAGCAWTDRDNRPLWNAFEAHLVPADTGAFVAALPLTVPVGLGAIVLDTLVVHPVQVMDDAWDDAARLWRDGRPDFAGRYYSELAFLPVRVAATPCTFAGSFTLRSLFAFPKDEAGDEETSALARDEAEARRDAEAAQELRAWIGDLERGEVAPFRGRLPRANRAGLAPDLARAVAAGNALARLELYRTAVRLGPPPEAFDVRAGLRDPDPVVRFHLLQLLARDTEVAPEDVERLCEDPNEAVRLRARARWKR